MACPEDNRFYLAHDTRPNLTATCSNDRTTLADSTTALEASVLGCGKLFYC
jgi:hypothetical protein